MYAIDDMSVFVRVVDRQGFAVAGRELRMSTAVVSSRIARLEKRLGVRLMNRTTRSISLTEEGRVYYDHCKRVLDEIELAEQSLAEMKKDPAGSLRVSVPIGLGRRHIAPMVTEFIADNPKIQVRLQVTDRVVDLVEEQVDVAIRTGQQPSSTLILRRVAPDLRIVCGAPAYFSRFGVPSSPEELVDHNCLLLRFPGSHQFLWRLRGPGGAPFNARLSGRMDSDSSDVLKDWALEGEGLIMASVWDVAPHLAAGELRGVLRESWLEDLSISALMPPRRTQPIKTRTFVDFLVERLRRHPDAKFTDPETIPLAAD